MSYSKQLFVVAAVAFLLFLGAIVCWLLARSCDQYCSINFTHAEYRIRILDRERHPLQSVVLDVTSADGERALFFPVTDYAGADSLSSDENGILICHHYCLGPDVLVPCGIGRPPTIPEYRCTFSQKGKIVAAIAFSEFDREAWNLAPDWNSYPRVKRSWQFPAQFPELLNGRIRTGLFFEPRECEFVLLEKELVVD